MKPAFKRTKVAGLPHNPLKRAPHPVPNPDSAAKGAEALAAGRFKEAVDIFRQLVRQDPRPEWRQALTEAYAGRARALEAKGMVKEAAIVLENTIAADGGMAEPMLYLRCLIRSRQLPKAAQAAATLVARDEPGPSETRRRLDDAAAALALLNPSPFLALAGAKAANPGAKRWAEMTKAAQAALEAWCSGAEAAAVDAALSAIALRSAFGPLRLIVKALMLLGEDRAKGRRLIEGIAADSAFFALRTSAEALLSSEDLPLLATGGGMSAAGRALAVEMLGLAGPALQGLMRLVEAEQAGPAALFSHLQKSRDLPRAEARRASLNLLPQLPDRLHQFDKAFTPLTPFERARIDALAAEAHRKWAQAEEAWLRAAEALAQSQEAHAKLALGVIYRHLSQLAQRHRDITGADFEVQNPPLDYLQRSVAADPDYLPTTLALLTMLREGDDAKAWGRFAEQAAERFPTEISVLQHAMEAAAKRKALKLAAGFGRKILALDPINLRARGSMIELGLAQARKQLRAKRPDLALKNLDEAAQWERPDRPSAELRLARGIVTLVSADETAGRALVEQSVTLLGRGMVGWVRASLEAHLLGASGPRLRFIDEALTASRTAPATKQDVVAVVKLFGSGDSDEKPKKPAKPIVELFNRLSAWLARAAALDWSADEIHVLADFFERFQSYTLLREYAQRGHERQPQDPTFTFYDIVARCKGEPDRMRWQDRNRIETLLDGAMARHEARLVERLRRFLSSSLGALSHPVGLDLTIDDVPDIEKAAFETLMMGIFENTDLPPHVYLTRLVGRLGRKAALDELLERYEKSPLAAILNKSMARQLFDMMIKTL